MKQRVEEKTYHQVEDYILYRLAVVKGIAPTQYNDSMQFGSEYVCRYLQADASFMRYLLKGIRERRYRGLDDLLADIRSWERMFSRREKAEPDYIVSLVAGAMAGECRLILQYANYKRHIIRHVSLDAEAFIPVAQKAVADWKKQTVSVGIEGRMEREAADIQKVATDIRAAVPYIEAMARHGRVEYAVTISPTYYLRLLAPDGRPRVQICNAENYRNIAK